MPLREPDAMRLRAFVLGTLLVLATVLTSLAAFASPPADEGLYLRLRAAGSLAALDVLDPVRSVPFVVAVAVLLLAGWRCRPLVVAGAAALAGSLALAVVLPGITDRPHPFDSGLDTATSYPSPLLLVLSTLAVLVPVSLWVTIRRRAVELAVGAVLWSLVLLAGLGEVQQALRWPLDVLGAAVLGGACGLGALMAVESHPWHARCAGCPWQEGAQVRGRPRPWPLSRASHRAQPLYRAAVAWTVVLAVVLGWMAIERGLPRLPESGVMGTGLEVPLNLGMLALIVLGTAVAGRWHLAGAAIVALAATVLGYAASVQYPPAVALGVTTAGFLPALLLWVQWHRVSTVRQALTVAAVTSLVLGGLVYLAADNHSSYWGPTQPSSFTPPPDDDVVAWMWSGAVTPDSVTVRARLVDPAEEVRLAVDQDSAWGDPTYSGPVGAEPADQNVVSLTVDGLDPDTDYYYALEVDGKLETGRTGHVATYPEGPSSFSFAVASCARTGSNATVFDVLRRTDPLFYLNDGDWFYGDVDSNDPELFRDQYESNLASHAQAALYAATPVVYVWDDHDSAGNDADRTGVSWPAAMEVYRQYVPHYPLAGTESPIYQAFTVGEVRFVLTDPRAARDPNGTSPRSMLGETQLRWLLDELEAADRYGLVVWVNGDPWVGEADPAQDTWAGFAEERRTIANAIAGAGLDNLLMISGDAHMLAYDDGTHTDYSDSGDASFPLLHAAALDRKPSIKGGPYSGPVFDGVGQFATVDIDDDGTRVEVTLRGRNYLDEVLFTETFTVTR